MIEQFLKHKQVNNYSTREPISPRTIKQYRMGLNYLSDDIKKPFKEATQKDIENHLGKYAQRTRNQRITMFHNFYRWVNDLDENDPLPKCVRGLRVKHVQIDEIAYRERLVSEEEYNLIIEHAKQPVERAVIETLWVSGARKDELGNMLVGDVIFDGKNTKITLRVSKTKPRVVIHPGRAEHLLKWVETLAPNRNKTGLPLFTTIYNGKVVKIHDVYAWRVLERICKRASLRHIKPHDLRHTTCTRLLRNGVPETFVKNQLGFSKDSVMLSVYDHNDEAGYENYLNGKGNEAQPTYQLLKQQKQTLELEHGKELQLLNERLKLSEEVQRHTEENIKEIIESLEPYKAVINAEMRKRMIGSDKPELRNPEKR